MSPLALPIPKSALFNPFGYAFPNPLHGMWADDPSWTGKPASGAAAASWKNRSGLGDPAQVTGAAQPLYVASVAALNNRGALQFDGTAQNLAFDIVDIAQPFQVVAVAKLNTISGAVQRFFATGSSGGGIGVNTTGQWSVNFGGAGAGGTADTLGHVFRLLVNGASSQLWVDEVSVFAATVGSTALSRLGIGAANNAGVASNFWNGYVAFAGVYSSAVDLTSLASALRRYYGTP